MDEEQFDLRFFLEMGLLDLKAQVVEHKEVVGGQDAILGINC